MNEKRSKRRRPKPPWVEDEVRALTLAEQRLGEARAIVKEVADAVWDAGFCLLSEDIDRLAYKVGEGREAVEATRAAGSEAPK
jgi:hypothetical protein